MCEKNIYFCNTYYHVLISILKTMKDKNCKSDLVVTSDIYNNNLVKDINLINRIKNKKIFNSVIVYDYSKIEIEIQESRFTAIKRFFLTNYLAIKDELKLKSYDKIYIFFDGSLIGHLLNVKKIKYNLLEDGMDTFKINYLLKNHQQNKKNKIKGIIKYYLNFREFGESKYIESIEVNNADGLEFLNKKIIEYPKKKLFDSFSKNELEDVSKIFMPELCLENMINSNLLITQPLFQDGYCDSIDNQINIYKSILNEVNLKEENVIIKPHPRENIDYKKYFPNSMILLKNFPLEILYFYNVKFKKIISISSTSINLFENCEKKIILGWEWIKNGRN